MLYVLGRDEAGDVIDVQDPLVDSFIRIAVNAPGDAEDLIMQFVGLQEVFGTDLASDKRFTSTLAGQFRLLADKGAAGAVHDYVVSSGSQ